MRQNVQGGRGWEDCTGLADCCKSSGFTSEMGSHWRVLRRVILFDFHFNTIFVADMLKRRLGRVKKIP